MINIAIVGRNLHLVNQIRLGTNVDYLTVYNNGCVEGVTNILNQYCIINDNEPIKC